MSSPMPLRKKLNTLYYISAAILITGFVMRLTEVSFWYFLTYPAVLTGTVALVYEVSVLRRKNTGQAEKSS